MGKQGAGARVSSGNRMTHLDVPSPMLVSIFNDVIGPVLWGPSSRSESGVVSIDRGLSHCDSSQMVCSALMGLFDEWHSRVVKDYADRGLQAPYDPTRKDQARWTFEPHVAMRLTSSRSTGFRRPASRSYNSFR